MGRPPALVDPVYAALPYCMRVRYRAVQSLGGCCARCGNDDMRVLDIDHVHGGGARERELGKYRVFKRVIDGCPGYQVLCANCHRIKTLEAGDHRPRRLDKS